MSGRDSSGRWRPGASGNPGGRPRVDRRTRDVARDAAEEAVLLLLELARDRRLTWTQRRRCCLDLVRLAYGRSAVVAPPALELLAGLLPPPLPGRPPLPGPENRRATGAASGPEPPLTARDRAPRRVHLTR